MPRPTPIVAFGLAVLLLSGCGRGGVGRPSGAERPTTREPEVSPEKQQAIAELKARLRALRKEEAEKGAEIIRFEYEGPAPLPGQRPVDWARQQEQAKERKDQADAKFAQLTAEYQLKRAEVCREFVSRWGPLPPDADQPYQPDPPAGGERQVFPAPPEAPNTKPSEKPGEAPPAKAPGGR